MIAFLHGLLAEKQPTSVELDVHGVGYAVLIPLSTYDRLPATGETCRLQIHHHIREDGQLLCGFATADEKHMFELLIGISGIGPKVALGVLSGLSVAELRAAIAEGNHKRLSSVRGVGKKTAERIVVELRDKIDPAEALASRAVANGDPAGATVLRDTVLALTALGFPQDQARKRVQAALDAGGATTDTEALLKLALASR
ncbi:MAG: Holliday junction branch migration protein RuvA [bacterium]